MKIKYIPFLASIALGSTGLMAAPEQEQTPIQALVDSRQLSEPVSPYEFGMFIEHIGTLIYDGLWAELLDDRKFFGPILDANAGELPKSDHPFRRPMRKWIPVGGESHLKMDAEHPFVGEFTPCFSLDSAEPRGLRQRGLTLVAGKDYTGRVYLRSSPDVTVTVRLRWGDAPEQCQSMDFRPTTQYAKYPFHFTAGADAKDATFEIVATGVGDFHVGTVSVMPADNLDGYRPEVIALLRELQSGMWRLPGGNVISAWNWYDSVGDVDHRPPYFDPVWNAVQSNDVGLDEFMTLCRLIEVEPYISVSAGFGDSHSAAEEVEYMNGAASTHMGALRAAAGHPEPYGVKFWNIGNEPYGSWQFGRTDLRYYVYKHNEFAKAMKKVDPSITLLASGSMPDRLWKDPAVPVPYDASKEMIGDEWDWTGGLFAHCMDHFDGMTEHWYAPAGMKYDPPNAPKDVDLMFAGYAPMDYTVLEWVRYPSNRVRIKAEQWEQYARLFPEIGKQGKFLSIDEYAYLARGATLKTALAYGMVFNEMLRYTDFLKMSAHTMGTSVLDITPTQATYNANGLVFLLFRDLVGNIPVALSGNSPQPAPQFPIDGDQPRVNAGSPTYPLDVVASLTPDKKTLVLSVVNATDSVQPLNLNYSGLTIKGEPTLTLLTGKSLDAVNRVGQPAEVCIESSHVQGDANHLNVAPYAISVYRIPVQD